jgi:hypothetical protein
MWIKVFIAGDDQPTLVTPETYASAVFGKVSHVNYGVVYEEGESPVFPPADVSIFDPLPAEEVEAPPPTPES